MKKEELLRYSGNLAQIAGIDKLEYTEGKAKGVAVWQVKTGSGFCFSVLPDKCLDIISASYKGVNLSYLFKGGVMDSRYFYPVEDGFLQNMCGGLLFTGGLRNAGGANRDDDGRFYPSHGRISQTPARNAAADCAWDGEDYKMNLSGQMSDTTLFGEHLSLERTIKTKMGATEFEICDVVENLSPVEDEFMLLYHMNLGYPFLDEDTRILIDSEVEPIRCGEDAAKRSATFQKPVDGGGEECLLHRIRADKDGYAQVKVENKKLGFGVYWKIRQETLPYLIEWKAYQSTDYALGIEPTNCMIMGRKAERENGTLKKIQGFERVEHSVTFGVYDL